MSEKSEWTCGHTASAMCAECYRLLARRAHKLADDNERLREQIEELKHERRAFNQSRPPVGGD